MNDKDTMEYFVMIQYFGVLVLAGLTAAKLDLKNQDALVCSRSAVDYNVTLVKGAKAGKFYKLDKVHKIDDCINQCCDSKKCDVAFMVTNACYMVQCINKESCEIQQAKTPKLGTILSVVNKKSKLKDKPDAEPAVDENLAERPLIPFVSADDGMTTVSAFGTGKYKRTKRSSDVIDLVVAVGCGTVAVCVGVAGVIMMTRRLIHNSKNTAA